MPSTMQAYRKCKTAGEATCSVAIRLLTQAASNLLKSHLTPVYPHTYDHAVQVGVKGITSGLSGEEGI